MTLKSSDDSKAYTSRNVVENWFPNCVEQGSLEISSPEDLIYNCVAWSLGFANQWVQPNSPFGRVRPWAIWPNEVDQGTDLLTYIAMYRGEGFVKAATSKLEVGFDKVAIYCDEKEKQFLHVSRQLPDGTWWSKLGPKSDVKHKRAETLGPLGSPGGYGKVWGYMKRPKGKANAATPLRKAIEAINSGAR